MDELIRSTIHEALEAYEPSGLRSRVIAAVPMERRSPRRWSMPMPRLQWATAFAAIVLTAALIAALVYSRVGPLPAVNHQHVPSVRLTGPTGIAVGPDGTIYVADYVTKRVFRVQGDGSLVTVAGGGLQYEGVATKASLFDPEGLAVAANGDLYIADNLGSTVRRVDRSGTLSTFVSIHATGGALAPFGLAFDGAGDLYVANLGGDVTVVKPDRTMSRVDLSRVPAPSVLAGYLAFDPVGNLYVSDRAPYSLAPGSEVPRPPGGCRIIRVAPDSSVSVVAGTGTCGYSGDGGPAANAELNDPQGIAFDAAGNMYVADSSNHRIRRIDTRGVITTLAGTGREGVTGDHGPAVRAELAYLGGVAIVQGRFLYVCETETSAGAYGAVRVVDLQNGTIDTAVSARSRVVS